MENRPVNVSGVTGSVVSIGTAGTITNNVNDATHGDAPGVPAVDTILVVSADPVDLPRLRLHNEDREIREALALSGGRERWVVQPWGAARLRDLTRALMQSKPRVVHFSGHGNGAGEIFLEDESGRAHSIPLDALKELFAEFGEMVECSVLNACFSEPQARAIAANVQYVVGTAQAVPDAAAIAYSVGFYTALGEGRSFPEAHAIGCVHFQSTPGQRCPPPVLISAQQNRQGSETS
jgi:hypothetical protein